MVHDPMADPEEALAYYNVTLSPWEDLKDLGALILAVPHAWYNDKTLEALTEKLNSKGCLIDVKSMLNIEEIEKKGIRFWRL